MLANWMTTDPKEAAIKWIASKRARPAHHFQTAAGLLAGKGHCTICGITHATPPFPDPDDPNDSRRPDFMVFYIPCQWSSNKKQGQRFKMGGVEVHPSFATGDETIQLYKKFRPRCGLIENVLGFFMKMNHLACSAQHCPGTHICEEFAEQGNILKVYQDNNGEHIDFIRWRYPFISCFTHTLTWAAPIFRR